MKHVLVLGAGNVSPALLSHLRDAGYRLTVTDRERARARARVAALGAGEVIPLAIQPGTPPDALRDAFAAADVVVSILPASLHETVARGCILARVPLVTASYVTPTMQALDADARAAGVTLLNEMGLDPGIDHLSAVQLIAEVHADASEVEFFGSYCGGLPTPAAATNPLRYKFSWSPWGVVQAVLRPATYLAAGHVVTVPPESLFARPLPLAVMGLDDAFECYPNHHSLPYVARYGVPEAQGFLRGTIRYVGWGRFWNALRALGWLDTQPRADLPTTRLAIAARLGLPGDDALVAQLLWLLAEGPPAPSEPPLERLTRLLVAQPALHYAPDEEDRIILQHELICRRVDKQRERRTATLVVDGRPAEVSAMSLTTGGALALGAQAILEGVLAEPGVVVPTDARLAAYVLPRLAEKGIRFTTTREALAA